MKKRLYLLAALLMLPLSGVAQYGAFKDPAPASAKGGTSVPSDRGLLVSDRDKIDFGSNIKAKSAITVTLVNIGGASLTIKSIRLSGVNNGFAVSGEGCAEGQTLAPGDACPLTVSWTPGEEGVLLDAVQVTHDGARGVLVIPVSVTGAKVSSAAAPAAPKQTQNNAAPGNALGKYAVVSRAGKAAVIAGPEGKISVRDGASVTLAGVVYGVKFTGRGLILEGGGGAAMLPDYE